MRRFLTSIVLVLAFALQASAAGVWGSHSSGRARGAHGSGLHAGAGGSGPSYAGALTPVVFADTFNRSNRNLIGDNGWAFLHASEAPSSANLTIDTNHLVAGGLGYTSNGTSNINVAFRATAATADYYAEADITTPTNLAVTGSGVMVRARDTGGGLAGYLCLYFNDGSAKRVWVFRMANGTGTQIYFNGGAGGSVGSKLRLTVSGSTGSNNLHVVPSVDGSNLTDINDSASGLDATGAAGIWLELNGREDNFAASGQAP